METQCPRCRTSNRDIARFCARCGLQLGVGVDGTCQAGRIRHPRPAAVPDGYEACQGAADLHYCSESSLGGDVLIGTEGVNVVVFNAGYPLCEVVLQVRGDGEDGRELFAVERSIEELPQGEDVRLEIPSYELSASLSVLKVTLVSAEFGREQ